MKISPKLDGIHVLELETLQATLKSSTIKTVKIDRAKTYNFAGYFRYQLGSTEY